VNTGINFDNYDRIPVEISGDNCPRPIAAFDECNFASMLQENVKVMDNTFDQGSSPMHFTL
jgi:ATP-dependent RNA helicase DDX3X